MTQTETTQRSYAKPGVATPVQRALVLTLLVALAAAGPVAATAGSFSASGVTGAGLVAEGEGLLAIDVAGAQGAILSISGAFGRLVTINETVEESVRFPLDPDADINSIAGYSRRYEATYELTQFAMALDAVTDEDAVSLLSSGTGSTLQLTYDARFQAHEVEDHVVEASHVLEPTDDFPAWQYYEYRSGDGVELSTVDGAEVLAQGDFEVYFWGQTLSYQDASQAGTVRTGYALERTDGQFREVEFVRDEHSRYAVLTVTDGILQYTQSSGPLSLFSSSIEAEPEAVTYREASGSILTSEGRLSFNGDVVRAEGGAYRWALADDGLAVSVIKAPDSATATNGAFAAPDPGIALPSWTWGAVGVLALVLLAFYMVPTLRGGQTVPSGSGWKARRADGYASLAASAENAGWNRLATFLMAWSLRVVPADPLRMVDLAILRARIGRHDDALAMHEAAHGWLVDSGKGDDVAHNAYEAAKAAAVLGRSSQALDWMRMAIEADPGLVTRVGNEPAFARLRGDPDYASLTVGGA